MMSDDAKARLLDEVRRTPSVTRKAARARAWRVLPVGILVALGLYLAYDGPEHGRGRPTWFYLAGTLSWAAVAALAMFGALGRASGSSWRSRGALLAVAVATPALLFVVFFAIAAAAPEITVLHAERVGFKCLGLTLAAAAYPLFALLVLRRESDPVHPAVTGAALGSACGASAGVMVELWCPVAAPAHVAFGHILPIALLALVGAVAGARLLALRGSRRR